MSRTSCSYVTFLAALLLMPGHNAQARTPALWDISHGVYNNYDSDGSYSDLYTLITNAGYDIEESAISVANKDLTPYDVIILTVYSAWIASYTQAEADTIEDFVASGGSLLVLTDGSSAPTEHLDVVLNRFGITGNTEPYFTGDLTIFDENHPTTEDMTNVYVSVAGSLTVGSGNKVVVRSLFNWPYGTADQVGPGRVFTFGDATAFTNSFIDRAQNRTFIVGVTDWLAPLDADADGYTVRDGDCDDNQASVHPGATEVLDGFDQDCDGKVDEGTVAYDDDGDGYSELNLDCDDTRKDTYPGAPDPEGDGRDNDCDGLVDEDPGTPLPTTPPPTPTQEPTATPLPETATAMPTPSPTPVAPTPTAGTHTSAPTPTQIPTLPATPTAEPETGTPTAGTETPVAPSESSVTPTPTTPTLSPTPATPTETATPAQPATDAPTEEPERTERPPDPEDDTGCSCTPSDPTPRPARMVEGLLMALAMGWMRRRKG